MFSLPQPAVHDLAVFIVILSIAADFWVSRAPYVRSHDSDPKDLLRSEYYYSVP